MIGDVNECYRPEPREPWWMLPVGCLIGGGFYGLMAGCFLARAFA